MIQFCKVLLQSVVISWSPVGVEVAIICRRECRGFAFGTSSDIDDLLGQPNTVSLMFSCSTIKQDENHVCLRKPHNENDFWQPVAIYIYSDYIDMEGILN